MNQLMAAAKIFLLTFFVFSTVSFAQSIYEIAPGTRLLLRMDNEINSEVSSVNDTFTATLAQPLVVREVVVLPVGTIVEGRITRVKRAAFAGKGGELTVAFEELRLVTGAKRTITGVMVDQLKTGSTSPARNVLSVIGGAALGAIIGAVSKADNGAVIGAGIGAGAGASLAVFDKGKEVRIKADEKFEIELTEKVVLPAADF